MTRFKQLALKALRCPVRNAIEQAWLKARPHAWRNNGHTQIFDPDGAVDEMKVQMGQLARLGVVDWWELSTVEGWLRLDWQLEVKFTFKQDGARATGTEKFRVW